MRAAFYTLGCKVNQYETESMREQFRHAGFDVVSEDEAAEIYVVNTCTVTNMADRKSRQYIRRAHKLNPDAVIAVTGCYAQMARDAVAAIDGVDIVTGTDEKGSILKLVQEYIRQRSAGADEATEDTTPDGETADNVLCDVKPYSELNKYEELGVISDMEGRTRAFIKIQEGCDRFCSYCIIPFARGKVRSRSRDEIVQEISGLVGKGYREIVLTGINTALYGTDLGYGGIAPLIEAVDMIEGDFRIRLSSLEPTVVDADYAASLLVYNRLCHHLHLSAQSGSDKVLAAMNRHYTHDDYLEIMRRLREQDPFYGISADIIVGFPGETDEDFRRSVDLVRESELIKTHVFKYSVRRGTKAASMPDQVDEKVKSERSRILIEEAEKTARAFCDKCRGQVRRVLFEQEENGMITGYTDNYIKVYMPCDEAGDLTGEFADVMLKEPYEEGMLCDTITDRSCRSR